MQRELWRFGRPNVPKNYIRRVVIMVLVDVVKMYITTSLQICLPPLPSLALERLSVSEPARAVT